MRFTIHWDNSMSCYRVSVPNLDGPLEVVPATDYDRLRRALDKPLRETVLSVLKTMPSEATPEHLAAQIEGQVQAWQRLSLGPDA